MVEAEVIVSWDEDVLKREKYADFLTKYLVAKKEPFVLNVNSPWGTGKTFFIKRWYESLKGKHPCVLFNAWKNDHSNDPLLSVISCIDSETKKLLPDDKEAIKSLLVSSGRLLKKTAPLIAEALAKKAIGKDGFDVLASINEEDEKGASNIVSKLTEQLITNNQKEEKAIENFIISLKTLVEKLTNKKAAPVLSTPLFIFIDELDRCRPLYAIELLERIKHLFGIPGIVFVIATDTEQLKHSINAIYGNKFNSGVYLRRFFNSTYTLPQPNQTEFARLLFSSFESNASFYPNIITATGITHRSLQRPNKDIHPNEHTLTTNNSPHVEHILLFSLFSNFFELDLRTQNQCYEKLLAIISVTPEDEIIQIPYLTFLVMFEAKDLVMFKQYFNFTEDNGSKRATLIQDNFNSFYNIRVKDRLYTAQDFVNDFSHYAFYDERKIMNIINGGGNPDVDWLVAMRNNLTGIRQYKDRVMLACELT